MLPFLVMLREVRCYLRDRADLAFSLLLPIVLLALLLGAFGGNDSFNGSANIVDLDGGQYARQLLAGLDEIEGLRVRLLSEKEADARLERANILLAIYIPQGFSERLGRQEEADLIVKQRGTGSTEGQITTSQVRGVAERLSREINVRLQVRDILQDSGIPQEQIDEAVGRHLADEAASPAVRLTEEDIGARPNVLLIFLPGLITMFTLFAVTLNAQSMVQERQAGTLERLMTTQLTVGQLFLGKFLAGMGRGFTQLFILMALAYAAFQVFTPLSFVYALVVGLVFAAAVSALGMLIASLVRTSDQAVWFAVFLTMAISMLGGTFFEVGKGSFIYTLSRLSISSYANEAIRSVVAESGSLATIGVNLGILAAVCVAALLISGLMFRMMPGGKR